MNGNISECSSEDIIKNLIPDGLDGDLRYGAEQSLLKRWRQGVDLSFLVELIQSERTRDRLRGAYYLGELGAAVDSLKTSVTHLADDPLSECRRAFVGYIMNSGYYDEAIGAGLARCLHDLDLYVRVATIKWAVQASDKTFEAFSRLVKSGVGGRKPTFRNPTSNDFWNDANLKRAMRGLDIARRTRSKENIQDIRKEFPEEDSFVLDSLHFSQTHHERLLK
ncbi:hypothetical protein RNI52_34760 [Labrys neptuniae]|uniref:hypothetical protein n=1 Tax=Labrys neptuniae TaxID=376174 RepID=UPI00288F21B7|nr:hypothetical protein [Labrys neptuniae]MDT3382539.1 hypothetical protein [Labrys neptuniae]